MDKKSLEKFLAKARRMNGVYDRPQVPCEPLPESPVDAVWFKKEEYKFKIGGNTYKTEYNYYLRKRDNGEKIIMTVKAYKEFLIKEEQVQEYREPVLAIACA